jgi:hypothetical protein
MTRIVALFIFSTISAMTYAQAGTVIASQDTMPHKDSIHQASKLGFAVTGTFGGGIAAANAGTPDVNHLNYPSLSNAQIPNANYSSSGGLNVGFDLDMLFGKQRNLELSAGLTYIYSKGTADYSGFHAEYEAQDGNGNTFRRLVTANQFSESLSFGNVAIPILFKYSTNPDKKLGAFIQFGPVLSASASAKGNINASIDFEGVYHYDQATKGFTYSPATAPGDWVITRQAVTPELGPNESADEYFNQLYARGYYVGLDKPASAKAAKVSYEFGGGAMLRAGGVFRASKIVNLIFGLTALIESNGHAVNSYSPITASNDLSTISLANMLNGTSSLLTMQVGVNIGVQVRLIK